MMKSTTTVALLVFSCMLQFTEGSGTWELGGSLKNYPGYGCLPGQNDWTEYDLTLKECKNACELQAGCRSIDWYEGRTGHTCTLSRSIGGGGSATTTSDCRYYELYPCISKNDDPSPLEVNNAMQAFCPLYATGVGDKGKPEYGGGAEMCKTKDQKYTTRLHQAMFHGMFGGASSSGRDCGAWCLFDVEEHNRHFRWDNKKLCWKTQKNRPCKDSTNEERGFAADIFDSFCAAGSVPPPP